MIEMMANIKTKLLHNLSQIPGWHTKRKIIVIESDDWGSIRMKSSETIKNLRKSGFQISDPYNLNDSLASEEDLKLLFEVLTSFKDLHGNHPKITANTIITNPDFQKIQNSDYSQYYSEIFTETLKKYPNHSNSFSLWKKGMEIDVFHPQYHGREHVNIFRWLKELQTRDSDARVGFNNEVFGLRTNTSVSMRNSFMRALDYENESQFYAIKQSLIDGANMFKQKFGYLSKSFIAPSYVWDSKVEEILNDLEVKYLQGIQYQYYPKHGEKELKKKLNYSGKKNSLGQIYLVRNAFFEPTLQSNFNIVEQCLDRIRIAFKWNKPSIIGSHRLNFIGSINPENRDKNLILLNKLLKEIKKTWPDVEYMTSDQLGDLMTR